MARWSPCHVVNAVMAQQAGAVKPQEKFKGPVKVFILAEPMKPLLQMVGLQCS